jgi:tetrahydromethanopterin S-methyltransferase subunit E
MPPNLQIMALLGLVAGALGLPALIQPERTRRRLGLQNSAQSAYMMRIAGTMLTALALILVVFAVTFWKAH